MSESLSWSWSKYNSTRKNFPFFHNLHCVWRILSLIFKFIIYQFIDKIWCQFFIKSNTTNKPAKKYTNVQMSTFGRILLLFLPSKKRICCFFFQVRNESAAFSSKSVQEILLLHMLHPTVDRKIFDVENLTHSILKKGTFLTIDKFCRYPIEH